MKIVAKKKQRGAETLEFVVIFGMFMALVITVFEFARALYTWNALTEATRRGARIAVVCPVPKDGDYSAVIKNAAIFDNTYTNTKVNKSPILNGLNPDHIDIRYIKVTVDATGNEIITTADATTVAKDIKFVEVSIVSDDNSTNLDKYTFESIIPFKLFNSSNDNHKSISSPVFKTTLPMESKGAVPTPLGTAADTTPECAF